MSFDRVTDQLERDSIVWPTLSHAFEPLPDKPVDSAFMEFLMMVHDLFQRFDPGPFSVEQAIQEARLVRCAVLTYYRARPRPE